MAITITAGQQTRRGGTYHSQASFTQSTATTAQALSITVDVNTLGMGTATGHEVNVYTVADGQEGQPLTIASTATGEAKVIFTNGTATGRHTFGLATTDDYFLEAKFVAGNWHVVESSATLSTGT